MRAESLTLQKVSDMTESLEDLLGQHGFGLLSVAVGVSSPFQLVRWIRCEACPEEEQLERLAFTYGVVMAVQDHKGQDYARDWFCDHLVDDDATIYDSIGVGNYELVRDSVHALGASLTA